MAVARASEIAPGSAKAVVVDGREIAVFNVGGTFYALDNICPHQGGPLGEGILNGETISCPWHMWEFDSRSGACLVDDRMGVPIYDVKVEEGGILVDLPNMDLPNA